MRLTGCVAALAALAIASGCGAEEPGWSPYPLGATLPDVARIECDAETTTVATARIRPQRDGVHLRFENRAGRRLGYLVDSERGGQGADLPAQGIEVVVALPPGRLSVACYDADGGADPSEQERVELEVADPMGLWTPTVPTCTNAGSLHSYSGQGAKGEQGAPVEVAERILEARGVLEAGDVVEAAGYPEQAETVVRLARDGETVAVVDLTSDGAGGWLPSTITACALVGLG